MSQRAMNSASIRRVGCSAAGALISSKRWKLSIGGGHAALRGLSGDLSGSSECTRGMSARSEAALGLDDELHLLDRLVAVHREGRVHVHDGAQAGAAVAQAQPDAGVAQ